VHVGGLPAELEEISAIAAASDLALIEDAAHAFPAEYRQRVIGSGTKSSEMGSHLVCFSFYATKTITTGEGGMIATDDEDLASRCRMMALHGMSRDAWKRYRSTGSWYYEILAPGFKYNMTDIAAALGLVQLRKADQMWRRREEIARAYNDAFSAVPELQIPHTRLDCKHAWHLYMLRLHLDRLRIDRAQFVEELQRCNIGCSVHFIPLHVQPYYRNTYGYRPDDFPVAFDQYLREISLPIYNAMSADDVLDVIDAVLGIVKLNRR
jgi:dTDP-4-amino-4,6-dideoxygalactose transaminase